MSEELLQELFAEQLDDDADPPFDDERWEALVLAMRRAGPLDGAAKIVSEADVYLAWLTSKGSVQ